MDFKTAEEQLLATIEALAPENQIKGLIADMVAITDFQKQHYTAPHQTIIESFAAVLVDEIVTNSVAALNRRAFNRAEARNAFEHKLIAKIAKERAAGGRLRAWCREDVAAQWTTRLNDLAWNGVEVRIVFNRLLSEGDDIVAATPRTITTTSGLVIGRQDLRQFIPLHVWPSQFEKSLTQEKEITACEYELEAKAVGRARPDLVFDAASKTFRPMAGPSDQKDLG